jgi:hypothetical protein
MNQSMFSSNGIGGAPGGFFGNRRQGGMNLGNVIVNNNPAQRHVLTGLTFGGAQVAPAASQSQVAAPQRVQQKVHQQVSNIAVDGPDLEELLTIHEIVIKYKKGDSVVPRLKKNLKEGKFHKLVKFRSDKKLEWSPQFYLDGDLTHLRGYMNTELLRINILDQLDAWKEDEESSGFDDKTDSEEEDSEEEEVETMYAIEQFTLSLEEAISVEEKEVEDVEDVEVEVEEVEVEVEEVDEVDEVDEEEVEEDE